MSPNANSRWSRAARIERSRRQRRSAVRPLVIGAALACAAASSPARAATVNYVVGTDDLTWGRIVGFKPSLPGRDLNGTALNGAVLDGRQLEGISFEGADRDGQLLAAVWLDGSRLRGLDQRGRRITHDDFVGVTFEATLDGGERLPVYVAAMEQHPAKGHKDVYGYELWYPTSDGWAPLCGRDEGDEAVLAIPLAGRWSYEEGVPGGGDHLDDPDAFTFACEGYVLAKCVTAGYKPWAQALVCGRGHGCEKVTLAGHHQACTRALRADYCGDGRSHTVDGTLISLYDDFGVRLDSEPWALEAGWAEQGALCVDQTRSGDASPECGDGAPPVGCSEPVGTAAGALLMTETELL